MVSHPVKERIGAAIGALAFLLLFGGAGALGLWAVFGTIQLGWQAEKWVKVQAKLLRWDEGEAAYSYVWQEREYVGTRVGTFVLGGSSEVDDWEARIDARLTDAIAEKKPVMALVDPENPAESLLDGEIRWKLLLIFLPLAIAFGGAGLAAGWMLGRKAIGWEGSYAGVPLLKPRTREALTAWAVALAWNGLSLPIAILAIPDLYARGEWLAVALVSIFPALGALILWGALASTMRAIRDGNPFNARSAT